MNVDVSKSNPLEWSLAGNKDGIFIEERRALLERFLRELARYDFIIESKEFKIFSRGAGEIDDILQKLPKQSALAILEKYRLNFKIDEDQDQSEMTRYREKINIFSNFIRKALVQVEVSGLESFNFVALKARHEGLHALGGEGLHQLRAHVRQLPQV